MKTQIVSWAAWVVVRTQIVTATFDPEVLQGPGGLVIALLLWLYVVVRPFWSVCAERPCLPKGPRFALSVRTGRSCGNAWRPSREQLHRRL
jgi:hypothetical protein